MKSLGSAIGSVCMFAMRSSTIVMSFVESNKGIPNASSSISRTTDVSDEDDEEEDFAFSIEQLKHCFAMDMKRVGGFRREAGSPTKSKDGRVMIEETKSEKKESLGIINKNKRQ
jgi:hypothetical protein